MNVLFVSAEVDPFAKVGGLADVVGSLPKALRARGVDARVLMPFYAFIDSGRFNIRFLFSLTLHRRTGDTYIEIFTTEHDGVPIYFVKALPYFGQETQVYMGWDDDVPRFMFFSQAVFDIATMLREHTGFFPDVLHVNDWHTGLVPFLLDQRRIAGDRNFWHTGALLSIHNVAYQGDYTGGWMWELGIPVREHPDLVRFDKTDNILAIAVAYSDIVTTVSPRYAIEIQYPYMGYGLDPLLRTRLPDLYGILNGIDMELWNPATDPLIVTNYDADNFREKRIENKRQLQIDAAIEQRDDVPIIGLVSRLVEQKGLDLAFPALRQFLGEADVQFVGLGSGEPHFNQQLWQLGADFHWKAHAFVGYNATIAQRIYAGCDIFLMPSHYEPCGVGQMLAMRYGALPLVRETGGLADTVTNYDNADADQGTGFVFHWQEWEAVLGTLRWAVQTYYERKTAWQRMQERAMRTDFSWHRSADEYIRLYEDAARRHRH